MPDILDIQKQIEAGLKAQTKQPGAGGNGDGFDIMADLPFATSPPVTEPKVTGPVDQVDEVDLVSFRKEQVNTLGQEYDLLKSDIGQRYMGRTLEPDEYLAYQEDLADIDEWYDEAVGDIEDYTGILTAWQEGRRKEAVAMGEKFLSARAGEDSDWLKDIRLQLESMKAVMQPALAALPGDIAETWRDVFAVPEDYQGTWQDYIQAYPGLLEPVPMETAGQLQAYAGDLAAQLGVNPKSQDANLSTWEEARNTLDLYIGLLMASNMPIPRELIEAQTFLDQVLKPLSLSESLLLGTLRARATAMPEMPFGSALAMLQRTTEAWGSILASIGSLFPGGAPPTFYPSQVWGEQMATGALAPEEQYTAKVSHVIQTIAEWTNPIYFFPIANTGPLMATLKAGPLGKILIPMELGLEAVQELYIGVPLMSAYKLLSLPVKELGKLRAKLRAKALTGKVTKTAEAAAKEIKLAEEVAATALKEKEVAEAAKVAAEKAVKEADETLKLAQKEVDEIAKLQTQKEAAEKAAREAAEKLAQKQTQALEAEEAAKVAVLKKAELEAGVKAAKKKAQKAAAEKAAKEAAEELAQKQTLAEEVATATRVAEEEAARKKAEQEVAEAALVKAQEETGVKKLSPAEYIAQKKATKEKADKLLGDAVTKEAEAVAKEKVAQQGVAQTKAAIDKVTEIIQELAQVGEVSEQTSAELEKYAAAGVVKAEWDPAWVEKIGGRDAIKEQPLTEQVEKLIIKEIPDGQMETSLEAISETLLAAGVAKLPGPVKVLVEKINPKLTAKTFSPSLAESAPAEFGRLVGIKLTGMAGGWASHYSSRWAILRSFLKVAESRFGSFEKVFGVNAKGFVSPGVRKAAFPQTSLAIGDVLEYGASRYALTAEMAEMRNIAITLIDHWVSLLRLYKIPFREIAPKDDLWHWFPRLVAHKMGKNGRPVMAKGVGRKLSVKQARAFETMEEGIAKDFKYAPMMETLDRKINEMISAIVMKRTKDYAEKLGLKPLEVRTAKRFPDIARRKVSAEKRQRTLQNARSRVLRAGRGERLTGASLQLIDRASPDVGARMRELLAVPKVQAKTEAGKAITEAELKTYAGDAGFKVIHTATNTKVYREGFLYRLDGVKGTRREGNKLYAKTVQDAVDLLKSYEVRVVEEAVPAAAAPAHLVPGKMRIIDVGGRYDTWTGGFAEAEPAVRQLRALGYKAEVVEEEILMMGQKAGRPSNFKIYRIKTNAPDAVVEEARAWRWTPEARAAELERLLHPPVKPAAAALPVPVAPAPAPLAPGKVGRQFGELTSQIDRLLAVHQPALRQARADYSTAVVRAKSPPYPGGSTIDHPLFRGKLYDPDIAAALRKQFVREDNSFLRYAAGTTSLLVMAKAAMDFSAPFIQGLPIFGTKAWVRATVDHYRVFFQPQYYDRFLVEHADTALNFIAHRGYLGTFEYFEVFPRLNQWLQARGKLGLVPLQVSKQTWGRFERAFGFFGDAARIYQWEALRPWAEQEAVKALAETQLGKSWAKVTEAERERLIAENPALVNKSLDELAQSLNIMTGTFDSSALGIGWTQQQFEKLFLFAPRYTRAGLTLAGNIFRGGMTGKMARRSIAYMLTGMTVTYVGISLALGKGWDEIGTGLNPLSGRRFMSIRIGDRYYGFPGIYVALTKLLANIAATIADGEMVNFAKLDIRNRNHRYEQPFLRFLFSRTSPLLSMGVELGFDQKTFFGEPIETPAEYAEYMGRAFVPIGMESLFLEQPRPKGAAFGLTMLGELQGLRVSPVQWWIQREEVREVYAQEIYGTTWKNLLPSEQDSLRQKYPYIAELEGNAREDAARWDDVRAEMWDDWEAAQERAQERRLNEIEAASVEFLGNKQGDVEGAGATFREKVKDAGATYAALVDDFEANPKYKAIYELFAEPPDPEIDRALKLAYLDYLDKFYDNPELEDEMGNYLWDVRDRLEEEFKAQWGEDAWDKVQQELGYSKRDWPPAYQEYQKAKTALKPYWELADSITDQKELQQARLAWRAENPDGDYYLWLFYDYKPYPREVEYDLPLVGGQLGGPGEAGRRIAQGAEPTPPSGPSAEAQRAQHVARIAAEQAR